MFLVHFNRRLLLSISTVVIGIILFAIYIYPR